MAKSIGMEKKNVKDFLSSGKEHLFVIPEYQRPYAWKDEQIETLFNDLWDFACEEANKEDESQESSYFLGAMVSYENSDHEQEIIDGQQRITSLFLLLRAIYTKLTNAESTKESKNFISQIEPCIWRIDKLTGEVDYSKTLISSKVISDDGNKIMHTILKTGEADKKAEDNYSKNYLKFMDLFDKECRVNFPMVYKFIYSILNQAILLPITADTQDTALTIFSTLNNRGLPLSDADIFKAKIYDHIASEKKDEFINHWRDIDEKATNISESIQQLFYYYMFYLRALDNDSNTTTPGIRKYFSTNKYSKLYKSNILNELDEIANLWEVVNKNAELENESWSKNIEILKALDTLSSYPNEYWKYPVIIYYLKYKKDINFETDFLLFLRKLIVELLINYAETPTINAVKGAILKLNVEIVASNRPRFLFNEVNIDKLDKKIEIPHRNLVRMILKVLAYSYSNKIKLLPKDWEIEHIFPQKWQSTYFQNLDNNDIKDKIEHLGNKTPFEKKLNIIAGNGYFLKKKKSYLDSEIEMTREIGKSDLTDWSMDNIIKRDIRLGDKLKKVLKEWNGSYSSCDI